MGTIISIIVGVIAIFAFLSYIATPKGEDAEEMLRLVQLQELIFFCL